MSNKITSFIDVHHHGKRLVMIFKEVYPCLHEVIKLMCEAALSQEVGEGDWQHLIAAITIEYEPEQLTRLEEEAKMEVLPRLRASHGKRIEHDSLDRPDWLTEEFDRFGFFVAREL